MIIKYGNKPMETKMYVTSHEFTAGIEAIQATTLLCNEGLGLTIKSIPAGSILFHEGDDAYAVYEIIEGVCRSSMVLSNGRRQIISFGYPSDFVGVSHDCKYHYECEAITDMKVRVFRKNACSARSDTDPDFSDRMLKYMAAEVCGMQEHFMMLGKKSATEKLASFLIAIADRSCTHDGQVIKISLPMSRIDIADFLGLTIETISRTFTKLRKDGIVEFDGSKTVVILEPSILLNVSNPDE
jgi:CRP-like cAMP-binding protein